jgi:Tfp pilus assembly protein FimV
VCGDKIMDKISNNTYSNIQKNVSKGKQSHEASFKSVSTIKSEVSDNVVDLNQTKLLAASLAKSAPVDGDNSSDNLFLRDLNYSSKHTVLKNETLSDIMLNYYGSKSFNKNILSLAIVHFNKKAFVRSNPNYLYSGKQLYLPSINEIKGLIIKKNKNLDENQNKSPLSSQIYFFGG